jgi:hypothetical protein
MRASARTRPAFLPRKAGKSIRSGTPPFGFPAFLAKDGAKGTRLFAAQTPFCFIRLSLRYSVASSRIWRTVYFRLAFPVIANLAQQGVAISIIRLPQSLTLLRNDNVYISGGGATYSDLYSSTLILAWIVP